jgi:hypothetical protein
VAVGLACVLALGVTGCGLAGGSKEAKVGSSSVGPSPRPGAGAVEVAPGPSAQEIADQRRKARLQRERDLRRIAGAVAEAAGLAHAQVKLGAAGRRVSVVVSAGQACQTSTSDVRRLSKGVRGALPGLKAVGVRVNPFGQGLAEYRRHACKLAALPATKGKVVYQDSGSGFADSPELRVPSGHWAVDYVNDDGQLEMVVDENGKLHPKGITVNTPGAGKQSFIGGARFVLHIAATGRWRVRVRALPGQRSRVGGSGTAPGPSTVTHAAP